MSEHRATLAWKRETDDFSYDSYDRTHTWSFDGGTTVRAAASPAFRGDPACVDPEEAFVAALASCHMLTFLAIAARKRFVVDRYEDEAVGVMEKNPAGRLAITRVTLRPRVAFSGPRLPDAAELERMHELAHEQCFIANSVTTAVSIEPAGGSS